MTTYTYTNQKTPGVSHGFPYNPAQAQPFTTLDDPLSNGARTEALIGRLGTLGRVKEFVRQRTQR